MFKYGNIFLTLFLPASFFSECGEGDVVCPSGLACIPEHEVCDGTPQCPLLGDEVGCGKFYCVGQCKARVIESSWTRFESHRGGAPCGLCLQSLLNYKGFPWNYFSGAFRPVSKAKFLLYLLSSRSKSKLAVWGTRTEK